MNEITTRYARDTETQRKSQCEEGQDEQGLVVVGDVDVMGMLLEDKRSEHTRRAYRYDLGDFFRAMFGVEPSVGLVARFLSLSTGPMAALILRYKARLIGQKLSEATVNRRLAAVMSLVKFARRVGATEADPRGQVEGERVVAYRDTRGISSEQARLLLKLPERGTLKGKRDYALLLLLLENALRRSEVVGLKVGDFEAEGRGLWLAGKGRGTQKERITLSAHATAALRAYLEEASREEDAGAPLFVNFSPAYRGRGLTANGLYKIVGEYAQRAGLEGRLSPHRLRHTAITMALDISGGDIRRVKRLSRHARLETLQIYDDNRADMQGELTQLLSSLLTEAAS